jgi:hypothetical protein
MAFNLLLSLAAPMQALALTGGPSQPEVQSFEPVSANQMVDPFTGDFTYNIPLLDVGGYPINISYHAGPGLDEEASWVGLGWNINPGVINRNMRGIPDDFFSPNPDLENDDNDFIKRTSKMNPSRTIGLNMTPEGELFSVKFSGKLTLGINYNNYRGLGFSAGFKNQDALLPYSVNFSNQSGIGFNVNIPWKKIYKIKESKSILLAMRGPTTLGGSEDVKADYLVGGVSLGLNSRQGMTSLGLNLARVNERTKTQYKAGSNTEIASRTTTSNGIKGANGSSVSFLNNTYIPSISDRNYSLSLNFTFELGGKFKGLNPDSRLGISYNQTGIMNSDRERTYPTFGFLYHSQVFKNHEGSGVDRNDKGRAIMDFNAHGGSPLTRSASEVQLPHTSSTFDIFSVAGQGISGMYRLHSASAGTVYDQTATDRSLPSLSLGIDLGVGDAAKLGITDVGGGYYSSKSGRWEKNNALFDKMNYTNTRSGADFEQVYFKNVGEKTAIDQAFYDMISGGTAARPKMDASLVSKSTTGDGVVGVKLENKLEVGGSDLTIASEVIRQKRDKRNQVITTLTAADAKDFGLIKYKSTNAKDHHIGEITAINPGGSRYVYATPLYNTKQVSYSFSFDDQEGSRNVDQNTNIAWFENDDQSLNNDLTLEKFFSSEEIPPYAHSYLLNAVLSPDYVDITDNGPTPDDNGSYTNITYTTPFIYNWRTPYATPIGGSSLFSANFQEGFESDDEDDKASFVYGEKEVSYVKTIETKTHVAVFITSDRQDGLGVIDWKGEKNTTAKLQQLDKIELYTAYDYYNYPSTKKPIKVVHFEYDYSLCNGVPNSTNAQGKLTLLSIKFEYGDSKLGLLSPYRFGYSNAYVYGYKHYDRWGNYKAAQTSPSNHEFPYSEQNKTLADQYAEAWSLTQITLPSGGVIKVEYEADDYAYVQDKAAMEMFKIEGFGNSSDLSVSSLLYGGGTQNNFIYFKKKDALDDPNDYLPEISTVDNKRYLYINAKVKLNSSQNSQENFYDYVRTYAEIIEVKNCQNNPNYGYVKIVNVSRNEIANTSYGGDVNPIAKNAWQMTRLNLPHIAYSEQKSLRGKGHDGFDIKAIRDFGMAMLGIIPELSRTFVGYNTHQIILNKGQLVSLNESWIRLQTPYLKKIGGGLRVKKVLIDNNWKSITSNDEESQTLGQIYDYTMDENGKTISSGVASYEPQIGGDENPLRVPSFYSSKKKFGLSQKDVFFIDVPLGENVYPSPSIGYRQVKIRNIKPDEDDDPNTTGTVTRHGTGYTIQKFFTAYDFPVITDKTTVDANFKKSPVLALLKLSQEIVGATQGFSIELNDMHGKPQAQEVYDEYDKLITKTEYKYKTDPNNHKQLDNTVTALKGDGTLNRSTLVGYEVEMLMHPRQLIEWGISLRLDADQDVFFAGVAPIIIPGFRTHLTGSYKMVRTATATKVINRFGILERVTVTDQSSSVSTINKAFDEETGEVLLTETTNEFSDKVYNFTYPAHWTYDEGMGAAYKNVGAGFDNISVTDGKHDDFSIINAQFIVKGDEMIANNGVTKTKVWVLDKYFNNTTSKYEVTFIDRSGAKLAAGTTGTYSLTTIRSGRRNMQTIPVATIVGNSSPVPDVGSSFFTNGEVQMAAINASAATFSDKWQTYRHNPGCWTKNCSPLPPGIDRDYGNSDPNHYCFYSLFQTPPTNFPEFGEAINPYVLGVRGNWRPDYTYVYYERGLTTHQRDQAGSGVFNATNIAEDGRLNTFKPFWYVSGGDWVNRSAIATGNPWTWNSKAAQINPDGIELENENALGVFSSAIFSFISKQPLAVTYNAKLRETLFDGFEDYPTINHDVLDCSTVGPDNHTSLSTAFASTQPITDATQENENTNLIKTPFHWTVWQTLHNGGPDGTVIITESEAHTGKKSLEVLNSLIKVPTKVYDGTANSNNNLSPLSQHLVNSEDLTDVFSPNKTSTQLLSYWVKSNDIANTSVSIELQGSPLTLTLVSESKPIEGWVKREYSFSFSSINIGDEVDVVISSSTTNSSFFDDIRIHPMDANMKSFVYDNKTLRLMATLDENNYATFFEYDEEGNLVRTKRETERGIITINENRQNIKKQP